MHHLTCLAAATLVSCVGALKEHVLEERLAEDTDEGGKPKVVTLTKKKPHKQRLENEQDVQYYGEFALGGQTLRGLLDTGSFELLAFSKNCSGCYTAAKFDSAASSSFLKGMLSQTHSYGSGNCTATDAFDKISIGSLRTVNQAFWLTSSCNMPVLQNAAFNAVVGIGPPGEPVAYVRHRLKELQQIEDGYKSSGVHLPWSFKQERHDMENELAIASRKRDLLDTLRVRTFSVCLGKSPGSPGWMVWHDRTRSTTRGVLTVHMAGNRTWSAGLEEMSFGRHNTFGCKSQCTGFVDTGTSLFAIPSEMFDRMVSAISQMNVDCSDLRTFPDLRLKLGGHKLRFPPSSYVGSFVGRADTGVQQFIRQGRSNRIRSNSSSHCELLFLDLGPAQMTSLGPVVILGMPFFREYYTTFDLGRRRDEHSIFLSKADESCGPSLGEELAERSKRTDLAYQPRKVDASKLRVPHWVRRLRDI